MAAISAFTPYRVARRLGARIGFDALERRASAITARMVAASRALNGKSATDAQYAHMVHLRNYRAELLRTLRGGI